MKRSPAAQLVVAFALVLPWLFSSQASGQMATAPSFTREELMAAFLYRLGSYVEWPESRLPDDAPNIRLCVVGSDPLGEALSYHQGAPLKGRTFEVRWIAAADDLDDCQILFLSESEPKGASVLDRIGELQGILTTSDRNDFTCRGGILRFFVSEESLKLEVDPQAAERAGLQISSKVLSLAQLAKPEACAGERL